MSKDNGRNKHGRFELGNTRGFQPGISGNPGGKRRSPSLRALLNRILDEDTEYAGERMTKLQALARRIVDLALAKPTAATASLNKACIGLLCERYDPIATNIRHLNEAGVFRGVGLTPAARMFQQRCAEWANEHDGECTLTDIRRIHASIPICGEDLGIGSDGAITDMGSGQSGERSLQLQANNGQA